MKSYEPPKNLKPALLRSSSVSFCQHFWNLSHETVPLNYVDSSIPLCAEKPADGDGLEEADPEEGHPRGGVEVHQLEEEYPALCAHGQAQGEQQAAHTHCAVRMRGGRSYQFSVIKEWVGLQA